MTLIIAPILVAVMIDGGRSANFHGTVVVAGGQGIIGSLVVARLRSQGVSVVVWDRLQSPAPSSLRLDLTDFAAVRRAVVDLVETEPGPFSFVMVQGAHELSTLADLELSETGRSVVDGNFGSVANIVIAAATATGTGSRFVLLGSIAAQTPIAFSAVYSASKAAASGFLEAAGYELDMLGHTWCIVDVGGVNTGFNEVGHSEGLGTVNVSEAFSSVGYRIHSRNGLEPEAVARRLAEIATAPRVRHKYTLGVKASVAALIGRVFGMWGRRALVSASLLNRGVMLRRAR